MVNRFIAWLCRRIEQCGYKLLTAEEFERLKANATVNTVSPVQSAAAILWNELFGEERGEV